MATPSSILAREIPWTEEPGGLQSMGWQRVTAEAEGAAGVSGSLGLWLHVRRTAGLPLVQDKVTEVPALLLSPGRSPFIFKQELGFPGGSDSKEPACQCRRPGFHPWVGKIPGRREWQSTPVFSAGEAHGWRSLCEIKNPTPPPYQPPFMCPGAELAVLLDCTDGDHAHASCKDSAALEQRPNICETVREAESIPQ